MKKIKQKIVDPKDLPNLVNDLRSSNKSIVTLNGSFDLLHAGHLKIINEAAKQADVFIMLLNSDNSIKQYKSKSRPIIPLEYRLEMIGALEAVDFVSWFEELDPIKMLSIIKPNVHVNGSEYGKDCIEADVVISGGGKLHLVDLKPGLSTSKIIEKIKLCE